jgi:hypothetical protein
MKIHKITSQLRNDIYGELICEHCGNTEKLIGYNDSYFHNTVLPARYCSKCGKNRKGELDANKNEK